MKTTYVPSEEMTNLSNSHNLHRLPSQAMPTIEHRSFRTLHVLIAALTMLFAVGVNGAWAEVVTATWNFQTMIAGDVNIQSKVGMVNSDVPCVILDVDATNSGKLYTRGADKNDAQFNANTIIRVPVVSTSDEVNVVSTSTYNYTIGGTAVSNTSASHTATAEEVAVGYVSVVAAGSTYLKSISVTQHRSYPFTTKWDFTQSSYPAKGIEGVKGCLFANNGSVRLPLEVDATSGKLADNGSWAQFNAGTKIKVPVASQKDVVTVNVYQAGYCNVAGTLTSALSTTHNPTEAEVVAGYILVEATSNGYLGSIELTQAEKQVVATPQLGISANTVNLYTSSYETSKSATLTLTGSNLTNGTYQVTQPSVTGLTISPTEFTVADGAVNQTFTLSYSSDVAVTSNTADFTFAVPSESKSETVTVTYGKTVKRVVEQAIVSEATTWDFTGVAAANIQLQGSTRPAYNEEFIYATLGEVKNDATFNAAALKIMGQWAYYQGNAQVNTIKFTTTVPGTVEVTFHPGTSANRTLYINGVTTGTSTSSAYVTGLATVIAGEVVISGKDDSGNDQALRISKIVFTPSAEEPIPTPFVFRNFSINMNRSNGSTRFFPENSGTYYVSVAENGTVSHSTTEVENYAAKFVLPSYNGDQHGYVNMTAQVVVTPGDYDIIIGNCTSGGHYIITSADGLINTDISANAGGCYHQSPATYFTKKSITVTAETTLTIVNDGQHATYTPYFAVEKKEAPVARTFVDFKVDFRTDPYTLVYPAALPTGVTVNPGTYNGGQHGATNPTITVPVDGPVDFTIGSCQYGNHTVTIKKNGEDLKDIDNNNGCESSVSNIASATYNNFVTYKYNSKVAATLTFVVDGYLPFFEAKACEYVDEVTVKYYDVDKSTVLKEEVLPGNSTLTYSAEAASGVTVAAGSQFRGFWKNSEGVKVKEGTTLTEDLNLYPSVTPIETVSESVNPTYRLTDPKFYMEEHDLISISQNGGSFHDGQHGWIMNKDGHIDVQVAGNATITIALCQYSATGQFVFKNSAGTTLGQCDGKVDPDGTTYTLIYTGGPETISICSSENGLYIHNIAIKHTGDCTAPEWSDAKQAWVLSKLATDQKNAAQLEYAIANVNSQTTKPKVLWIPNGTYDFGAKFGTEIPAGFTLRGESMDGVLIKNQLPYECIDQTATLRINGDNVTLEDLTLKCRATYGNELKDGTYNTSSGERGVCLMDRGNNNIFRHVKLDGYQDTYYSWKSKEGNTSYFYDCVLMGNTDFLCGSGNVWFESCKLLIVPCHSDAQGTEDNRKPYIVAPSTLADETGYIFNNCIIENSPASGKNMDGNFYLGRGWNGVPRATFINTVMKIKPDSRGWSPSDMNNTVPVWKEIGSVDESGNAVDVSGRPSGTVLDPATDADYQKLPAPASITVESHKLTWAQVTNAASYNIYYKGVFFTHVAATNGGSARMRGMKKAPAAGYEEYEIPTDMSEDPTQWDVRAINAKGVLGLSINDETPASEFATLTDVKAATANPFGFATASSRTAEGTTAVTGGGMHDIDAIMTALGTYTAGTSKQVNGKNVIVLQSTGADQADAIKTAITNNDVVIFDGAGANGADFIVGSVMKMTSVCNKTILGINGARLCTEWYLKDTDKAALDAVNAKGQSTSGVGGQIGGKDVEPAEYVTRTELIKIYGAGEPYRNAGVFEFSRGSNLIIRNIKFVGPGSVDVGGYDLLAFKEMTHAWVDHCEFTDGIDGNFDITDQSDFVTVSWNKFSYTNRSYVHQNTNLVGSSDTKTEDQGKLNITFAYNQWGEGCNARMPMVRYGKVHLLNNYYTCVGNGTSTVNPRKSSEVLLDGNHWVNGIKKIFEPATGDNAPAAYTWNNTNVIKEANPQSGCGAPTSNLGTVTVPYNYSAQILDPETLPTVIPANDGAILYGSAPVLTASDLTAVTTTKELKVGETYTLAKSTDYTTSSTGAVTYSSNNTAVATVGNNGQITAVAVGTATITISQASDGTYEAGEAQVTVTVTAAGNTETKKLYEFTVPTTVPSEASHTADYVGELGTATTTYTYGDNYWALDSENGSYLRYSSGNAKLTVALPTGMKFEEGDVIKYTYQDQSTSKTTYPIFKSNITSASIDAEKDAAVGDRGEHTASIIVGTGTGQLNIVGESSFNVERGGGGTVDLKALSVEREVSTDPEDVVLYDLKKGVGSAEVTAATATVTAATSLVLSNTAGRIKITPKDGEKFKNGDKVEFSGTIGNTERPYGLKIFAADGTTSAGELYVDGTTSPLKVSGALTLSSDADYIFIGRYGGTTTTMTDMTITRPGSVPTPPTPTDVNPKWDEENSRWEVVQGDTDAENGTRLKEALEYLNVAANVAGKNKTLYLPNGTYDFGETALTSVPADFHLIGESQDGVIIKNQLPFESIKYTATLKITGANVTLENMTIKCRATYGKEKRDDAGTIADSNAERGVCVQDCGNGSHYINVTLDGLQDTYYSNGAAGMTATFYNCIVRGNVDFFCGNGDITVNNSRLQIVSTHGSGGTAVICAPATYTNGETQGYLFDNCIVEAATSAVDCLVSGHSSSVKFALARGWYAGNGGTDRTPRVTFKDTEFEIKPYENWTTMGSSQPGGAPVFQIINTGIQFTDEAKVIDKTNKPFAYATANDRTNPASVSESNITGGGEYDLEKIMELMGTEGTDYTVGTTKTINGHKAIVLKSDNTVSAGKETRVPMDSKILNAIKANDIIVLDGSGTSTDFVVSQYIRLSNVKNKTIVGINGARLCTEWYLTDYFKSLLENVPTSSGTGVNSASTTSGGGVINIIDNKGVERPDSIKEEGEYLTRKTLLEATGDKTEKYRYSGVFYIDHSSNLIIRNFKFIGPGSLDCAGYDLMAIIDGTNHCWVDHCEFVDGMDGNFDITNGSDFITVSWCKFYYTDRSYAHQNTNLVGSSDDKGAMDRGKLNITFAYNEWGANCRARMPMARFGRIHMLNNYYNCAGNSEYAMNPRIESEFLVEGNYWEKGVRRAYNPNGQSAVTWGSNNYYADKAADKAGSSMGSTVTVPYQYSSLMLDPHKVPEVLSLNGGAKLYQKPYFTTNLGVVDTDKTAPYEYTALLSECEADGLTFSVWAENAHTFQWYMQEVALDGTASDWTMIDGENRNTYTYMPRTGIIFNIKCKAFGVSGETESDVLKVTVDGESKPIYITDLDETKTYNVVSGSPQIFTVNAGTDNVTYQWYKSANADGSEATPIPSATDRSYTYNPTATTGEIVYLFCRATNQQGSTDSKIVKVKGIYRNVKFHMYATYDANANNGVGKSSVFVVGGESNIVDANSTTAHIDADADECKATASNTNDIAGLRFENAEGSSHSSILGVSVMFKPTTPVAIDDKIEIKMNTSSASSPAEKYGFYLSKTATITGDEDANIIQKIGIPTLAGKGLYEYTYTATEALETFYLIPFVDGAKKNVNLANVVVYSGDVKRPVDAPAFTRDLDASYEVSQDGILELEVDYDDNDVSAVQWYKNTTNSNTGGTIIAGATGKKYSVPTSELGITYYYAVITGKTPYNETKVASVSTKVTVKAKATSFKTYTYDMTLIQGITASDQSISASIDIPSIEDPEGHIATYIPSSSGSSIRLLGQDYGDGFKAKGYVKIGGKSSTTNNYITVDVDNDDATITVYIKGGGSSERSIIVYNDKNNIPSKDNAILNVDGTSSAINYGTTPILKKGTYYIGALGGASYVYGIVVTVPEDATAPKDIVHYKIANDASLTKDTEYEAELGKIVFGNVSITKITPAEGDPFSGNKLDGDPSASGTKYAKIIMPEGMPVKEGDIIKLSGFQEKSDNPSSVGFAIYPTRAEGMTKETALYFTKAKDILEEFEYKVPAGSNLIDKTEFFVFRDGANTVFFHEITITREMKAETECSKPVGKKGTWNATAEETWNYTISSSTATAVIHYQVNSGEEIVASVAPKNSVNVALKPGDKVKAWATDSQNKIDDSEVNEFTVADKPQTAKPVIAVAQYSIDKKGFDVTISGTAAGAKVYYTTDGTDPTETSTLYNDTFVSPGDMTIKAIAIEDHYNNSDIASANIAKFETDGSERIVYENGSANNADNVGLSYFVLGNPFNAGGIAAGDGIKYRVNSDIDKTVTETPAVLGFRIKVNDGFVIKKIVAEKAYTNAKESDGKGQVTLTGAYVDVTDGNYTNATSVVTSKVLPYSDKTAATFETSDNLNARKNVDFTFTVSEPTKDGASKVNQAGILFRVYYEVIDAPKSVTINGEKLSDADYSTLTTSADKTVTLSKEYNGTPTIIMNTEKGYEHPMVNVASDDAYRKYQCTIMGTTYTVKAMVEAIEAPFATIAEDISLAGGYKVTVTPDPTLGTVAMISIDGGKFEVYDSDSTYYALKTVDTKTKYTKDKVEKFTDVRSLNCPDNSYEAGKPFAVYLYVNGYSDNQVGAQIYNNNSFATDKIYNAVANQFNVIPLDVKNNNGSILDIRSDINDAKLVVITETLSNSGSVEIEGVGSKGTQLGLTLKRDVLDHTNVLNMKMFMNGSSSANNQRWQWAQPRAMASELTSIMPCTPDGGGMYEIFGNATMSRDASINLWDDINTENMLYHLQPVFNFNEENETRPNFTPLALVIDPEEPEDQREDYHAIHFYKKNDFQYIAFGLSINEWPQYNNNVYAIIDKIGEMIIAGKSLDSKLTGIVKPQITDNGDGSANVFNNNLNADTYYVVYTENEATGQSFVAPTAENIINKGTKANDNDFHTQKYTEKMYIFAVSKLGADAVSEVVEGTVEGNSIRYVIRENDDPAAQGMVANYPFDLTVNSGTFNMPYNQSWKKDGYTVKEWEVTKSSDPAYTVGTKIKPSVEVSGLTQDITVKAIWSENTFKVTDLSKTEDKAARTVTWEFLQSKGAPALAMERTAGNMQAILVGQAKFRRDAEDEEKVTDWIDVPMTINTDNLATLPDNGTEYHGKFNNVSTNWAKELKTTDAGTFKGSDYAQVRTGTQFTFPAVYGMNVVYKQVDLVESVNGVANGNVNRSQVSQSFLNDGTKTADVLNSWKFVNPGFQLDANGKVVMVDGKAQLAKTSTMYEQFKAKGQALGLYDEENGGNHVNGGLIYYTGDGTQATLTSMESAQYIHVGATTGKPLGGLNYGSVFMQSLSVVYPELYDLTCTWNPANSELDPEENPGKIEKLNDPRPNCGGRYVLYDDINLKLTPAYGYYVDVDHADDPATEGVDESYYFMMDGNHPGQALNLIGATSKIYRYKDDDPDPEHNANYSNYSDEIKANIPVDGAYITMKVMDIDLVVSMKKWPTVKYNVAAEPSTYGYVTFNSGNGRPHEDEYKEFPTGKTIYITAHPNTDYKFKEWRRNTAAGEILVSQAEYDALVGDKTGYMVLPAGVTKGDGIMVNPFDKEDKLEKDEMMFTVSDDNNDFTYVAIFEEGKTGIAYYEFDRALLKTSASQKHTEMTPLKITADDRNQFPKWAESKALNIPEYYTLFKPGYTLDHWVEIEGTETDTKDDNVFTPTKEDDKFVYADDEKEYRVGTFYYFESEGESKHLVPVFTKNTTSYDYRATAVDITWDLRLAENAQRVDFRSGTNGNTKADTKIYYSTHAKINNGLLIDVPLTITLGNKGKFVNVIEEEDKWCALGEGTEIQIPSGLGAKFTIASLSKMETTAIDGVVPTSYTVENIDGADVYLYTYTTQSEATSVTLKIGNDFSYYKYIRAELPSADAVPLTTTVNNPAFGTVEIAKARTTADAVDANNTALLAKINATRTELAEGQGEQYTLGLGTIVSLHAKREHLYVLDYFEDGEGHKYYYNKDDGEKKLTVKDKDGKDITDAATAVDENLKIEKVQDFNTVTSLNDIQLTFQVQSYSESMHAVYKENTLYQVNYTSGEEAEGEAPGMTLVEDGESFTVPAENHHLYVDGQTLRYWVDEDGNKYDLGQSYILGQTFTASKDLPSGITSGKGFTVPKKDLFLSPVFKVNDFTVLNLSTTATAKWPLSRKGGATYEGNGDIVINYEGINGIYVTPLKLSNGDFIDLKMDIRGENGKANNVNSTDRCQINSGTVFGVPSSSNCTFTLNSANSSISAKIDNATVEGQQTVSSNYTGDKTQIDINFTGNTYLYEVVAEYRHVTTDLPELDYATVGNISLGALGTPLAGVKLSTLKNAGEVSGVPADLSNSTTGIMPVVRGTATRGGYVEVTQATIDNPVATMLVKTPDGVTVSVYKIGFTVTYPNIPPRVTDLKIDRKYQCDLKKMYDNAIADTRVDGTNYINDEAYLKYLGVDGDNAVNERVNVNGVINIKFSTKMAETVLPASTFQANGTGKALGQAVYSLEGQTLTFTYKGLDVNTEYDFIIPAGTFKDVFWAESTEQNKPNHIYNEPIRIHFKTVETAITTERRVINYVVTHNQASHFDATEGKMVADGARVQVASDELIRNLEAAGIEHGTLDHGVELANAYNEAGKRFYIFVPDGEYQLMGNDFVKSVSSPIGEDGKTMTLGKTENVYSGITTISKDNVSITGQSQEKTIVYNHPAFEGLSNASTLKLNGGIANFYAQDMTIQNRFDFLRCRKVSSKAVAPALWDRSKKPIFKNVKFDSYQDTYYTNANSQFDDTRGYAEDCTIMGYVDFICGDGDHWFQNSNMVVRQGVGSSATNMFAPRQYDTQKWGYVMNECTFSAENSAAFEVNNGKMTIARPWTNSPAETLIRCKYDVLSTDDGYKKMSGTPLVIRMQEYMSYDSNGKILDLSKRSLRNSTPAIGSYDAVMTPSKAAEYNIYDVMGGEDGYDPTLYTAQVNMPKQNGIKQDDTFLTWDDQKEALCYFLFMSDTENGDYKLFAVTDGTEFEMGNAQIDKWFIVRAANQRGGLGEPTDKFQYKAHESYKRELINNNQVIDGWRWSTIYLDFDAKAPVVQHEKVDSNGDPVLDTNGDPVMEDEIFVYALVKVDATKLTFKRVKIMEKNVGYLVKARPRPEEYEFKYTEKTPVFFVGDVTLPQYRANKGLKENDLPNMSLMNGSIVNKSATGISGYTLASKTSYGLGFYKYTGSQYNAYYGWLDAALVAEAQKALADGSLTNEISAQERQAAKSGYMRMVFDDDIAGNEGKADDITDIFADPSRSIEGIYTLSGQRITEGQLQPGRIYIINGKKVLVK